MGVGSELEGLLVRYLRMMICLWYALMDLGK